ncbi:hypothetical protein VQH23_07385 [Pararoseomonas sp. SCSIO 73927]|uniref:phage baseplate assembly protein n=1 Tax=Pararoseomonas sp. SCSIO 73927 TaxID=3114537 RepID=UPI0030CC6224
MSETTRRGFTSAAGLEVVIADRIHRGWREASIEVGIEAVAGKMELKLAERWAGEDKPRLILPGQAFKATLDGEIVIEGFIEAVDPEYDETDHVLTITGRERTQDLVDCAAVLDGPHEWKNIKLDEACRRICAPYGILVEAQCDVGAVFPRFSIEPGEAAWDTIERHCRQRAVLATGNGRGTLLITRSGLGGTGAGPIQLGGPEGNIRKAKGVFDWSQRHHLVVVRGQAQGGKVDGEGLYDVTNERKPVLVERHGTGPKAAQGTLRGQGRARDAEIGRYRPKVIIAETQGGGASFQERAEWDVRVAAGRSRRPTYTVPGWRGSTGALWRPNTMVPVADAYLDVREELLVAGVKWAVTQDGSLTELQVTRKDAFARIAEPASNQGQGKKKGGGLMGGEGDFYEDDRGRFVRLKPGEQPPPGRSKP